MAMPRSQAAGSTPSHVKGCIMFEALGVINAGTFALGTIALMLTPGPNSLFVLSTGIRFGKKAGWRALAGIAIGDALLMLLASAGAAAAFAAWPLSFNIIRIVGASYLAWIGLRVLLTEFRKPKQPGRSEGRTGDNLYIKSFFISLSNPNTIIFYISFFVQFVDPSYPNKAVSFLTLACIVELVSVSLLSLLIITGSSIAVFFQNRHTLTRLFRCLLGVLFLCFGLRLALSNLL